MKRFLITLFLIVTLGVYGTTLRNRGFSVSSAASTTLTNSATPPTTTGVYKDGTFTGSPGDAFYGLIQVQVTVANGNLSDVQFLQYPNDRGNSVRINMHAMPILKSEAIQVQNANVNIVSGATASSIAFQQSLASALQQAQ